METKKILVRSVDEKSMREINGDDVETRILQQTSEYKAIEFIVFHWFS
jgi:hypothetical protein